MSSDPEIRKYFLEVHPLELSTSDVENLIRKYDFYSLSRNPLGKGIHTSSSNTFAFYHNKEVVYDRLTGLCWQRSGSTRELSWYEAQEYVADLQKGGYGGLRLWDLPHLSEALSLVEPSRQNYNSKYP